jgi:Concanavalin A-like lectin/glucanases superfamily
MKTLSTIFVICIALVPGAFNIQAANCVQFPGLVSWWPGERDAVDIIGGNNGVLLNGATFAPGKYGQAFSFNGTGAHVRIADNANLHLTNGLTLAAWIYPTVSGVYQQVISKWDVVFDYQKAYGTAIHPDGRFYFTVCADGDESLGPSMLLLSTNTAPANQWTHVAATYDGATMKVYLNGKLESQADFPYGIFPGTNDLAIGAIVGGVPAGQNLYPFSGQIDEPAIYNRALSAGEIQAVYVCQPPPTCMPSSGLVSQWSGESNAVDSVGGNTGVLLNGATFAPGKSGRAFSFNGSGAHVRVADNANLHLTNGLTVLAWVNPSGPGYSDPIISKWDAVYKYQKSYNTWLSQSKFIFNVCANGDELIGPNAALVSTGSVPPNQWTHVAATYDGSTMKVYINGQFDNQVAFQYGIFPGTNDLGIGAVVGGIPIGQFSYPFSGLIDEPAIYNRALSAAEIQQVFVCQMSPVLSLGLYPGLTINGTAGQTVAIQYATNVNSLLWTTITNVTLTQPSQLWIDTENNVSTGNHPQRFYRALVVP